METLSHQPLKHQPYFFDHTLAFVDIETTGSRTDHDRITEIAVINVDKAGVHSWSTLINPGCPIPQFISHLTGIDDNMVARAPRFEDIAAELLEKLDGYLFIAHNVLFDYRFIQAAFARMGKTFYAAHLCTVKLSRTLTPEYNKHNLDALKARYNIQITQRHRALADAEVIYQVWKTFQTRFPEQMQAKLGKLIKTVSRLESLLAEVALFPHCHGVYMLRDYSSQVLWVGRAHDLNTEVVSFLHKAAQSESQKRMLAQVARIDFEICSGVFGTQVREMECVQSFLPSFQQIPKQTPSLVCWVYTDQTQTSLMQLTELDTVDFATPDLKAYGMFHNAKHAEQQLRRLAHEHHLCLQVLGLEQTPRNTPCLAYQYQQRCLGACIGKESVSNHQQRLLQALAPSALQPWPSGGLHGCAYIEEDNFMYLLKSWRMLARVSTAHEWQKQIHLAQNQPLPRFQATMYHIILAHCEHLQILQEVSQ